MIDSSAFVPAADESHPLHARARKGFVKLSSATCEAILTDHVFGESFTVIRRVLGNSAAAAFLKHMESSERSGALRLELISREDLDSASNLVLRVRGQKFSFIDALNVAVARRIGAASIFGFDHHFFTRFEFRRWI